MGNYSWNKKAAKRRARKRNAILDKDQNINDAPIVKRGRKRKRIESEKNKSGRSKIENVVDASVSTRRRRALEVL